MESLLLLAPDIVEVEGLLQGFTRRGISHQEVQVGALKCMSLSSIDVLLSTGGNGKSQYGVQAQYLIDRRSATKLLMCVGASGRLTDAVEIGDLVVATATVEHDYNERFNPEPLPQHDADANGLAELIRIARSATFPFGVNFGIIASGDEDIVDPDRAAELRTTTNALCVAWEGSGGARAARMSGIGFLEVRGITDSADGLAAGHFHENVRGVMFNVVDFLLAWRANGRPAA
jgi:adenosylhomocysteine nucleosidase